MSKIIVCSGEYGCQKYSSEGHEDNRCCAVCPSSAETCEITCGYAKPEPCEFVCMAVIEAQENKSAPECKYFKVEEVLPNEETKDN